MSINLKDLSASERELLIVRDPKNILRMHFNNETEESILESILSSESHDGEDEKETK